MLAALSLFLVVSAPLPPRNALLPVASPAIAMAKDQRGVVVAWTMRNAEGLNRIYVTRIDANGEGDGHARELPLFTTDMPADASCPSIAMSPSGSGFTMAWMELPSLPLTRDVRAVYTRLDAELEPAAPSLLKKIDLQSLEAPVLVRSGPSTWLTFDKQLWQLHDDGTLDEPLGVGFNASDMVANGAFPRLIGRTAARYYEQCKASCLVNGGRPWGYFCLPGPDCTYQVPLGYALTFTAVYSAFSSAPFTFESTTRPAIANDGNDTVIAWFLDGVFVFSRFPDSRMQNLSAATAQPTPVPPFGGRVNALVRPDIATDGTHYVMVWQTAANDIAGASLDAQGNVSPFSVAATQADEHDPSVIAIRPGLFFVAYEKISGTDRRIAGEFITFDGRQRPVR